jgi:hypothetical protein
LASLGTLSRRQRAGLYKRLTQISYISNDDKERLAALRIRNQLMRDTYSDTNKSEGERPPVKTVKPSDFLPDALKDDQS